MRLSYLDPEPTIRPAAVAATSTATGARSCRPSRGIAGPGGLVINGCMRADGLIAQIGFAAFARGLCIHGTSKGFGARGFINHALLLGDVVVNAGESTLDIHGWRRTAG